MKTDKNLRKKQDTTRIDDNSCRHDESGLKHWNLWTFCQYIFYPCVFVLRNWFWRISTSLQYLFDALAKNGHAITYKMKIIKEKSMKYAKKTKIEKLDTNLIKILFLARVPETWIWWSFFVHSFLLVVATMYKHDTLLHASNCTPSALDVVIVLASTV